MHRLFAYKKVFFILTFLLLFIVEGDFILFNINQFIIKQEIRNQAENNSDLIRFEVNPSFLSKIQWTEVDKEFVLNEEMYDVVKVIHEHGHQYVLCMNDKLEEKLIRNFYNFSVNKVRKVISSFHFTFVLPDTFHLYYKPFFSLVDTKSFSNNILTYISIPSPPPKV